MKRREEKEGKIKKRKHDRRFGLQGLCAGHAEQHLRKSGSI